MPVTPMYPDVYIEEIPNGVRTITEMATLITAFIGRAHAGPPVNRRWSTVLVTLSRCLAGSRRPQRLRISARLGAGIPERQEGANTYGDHPRSEICQGAV